MKMNSRLLLGTVLAGTMAAAAPAAFASSHREAPAISGMPRVDSTDFYMFRSFSPARIAETGRVQVLPFLDLTYVLNTGVSFSTGAGALPQWGLSLFAVLASLGLMIWVAQSSTGAVMAIFSALA